MGTNISSADLLSCKSKLVPYNPKSKANLGKPKTKVKRKNFALSQGSINYLDQFDNQTAEIERLIAKEIAAAPIYDPADLIL
jgi:hypothetical protein